MLRLRRVRILATLTAPTRLLTTWPSRSRGHKFPCDFAASSISVVIRGCQNSTCGAHARFILHTEDFGIRAHPVALNCMHIALSSSVVLVQEPAT